MKKSKFTGERIAFALPWTSSSNIRRPRVLKLAVRGRGWAAQWGIAEKVKH